MHNAAHALLDMFWAPYWNNAAHYNEYYTMISMCTIHLAPWLGASAPLLIPEPVDSHDYTRAGYQASSIDVAHEHGYCITITIPTSQVSLEMSPQPKDTMA